MNNPKVSIVILTKNGGNLFQDSIKMIFTQKTSFSFEVIIIDSGSTDGTLEFLKAYPIRLFQIKPNEFCFGPTRNFGFNQAIGKYIITISQDVVPASEGWVENLIQPLVGNSADIVQGCVKPPEDRVVFFWERKDLFYFTSEGIDFCNQHGGIGLSCTNMAIKKDVWQKVGFSNAHMNEDKMLQKSAYTKGFRIIHQKNAIAYHGHTYKVSSLIKRCENEGFGWRDVGVKYTLGQMLKDMMQERWVYGLLVRGFACGEIKTLAEILFLFVRPIFLYKGNLLNKKYRV